jgi:hypothetical protein
MNSLRYRRMASAYFKIVLLLTLGLVVINQTTFARTLQVPHDATTLQAAIDLASIGDQILVAPGTYTGTGNKNLSFGNKDLVVRSEGGPEVTVLDLQGSGRAFVLFGPHTRSALVEGFTIANGDGNHEPIGGGGMIIGGGSPTIRRCVFRNNQASGSDWGGGGGGLACHGSSALIEDCEFIQNTTVRARGAVGGGMASHESSPEIRGCRFAQNRVLGYASAGGGIYVHQFGAEPGTIIEDCVFTGNESLGGGGASIVGGRLARCTFEHNVADGGAGISLISSEMVDCWIAGNTARQSGGGVDASSARIANCVITENQAASGGGLAFFGGSTTLEQCLIADNLAGLGGGILQRGGLSSLIQRCTIARNRAAQGSGIAYPFNITQHRIEATIIANGIGGAGIQCSQPELLMIHCTDMFGNEGGDWTSCVAGMQGRDGNFSADPLFCGLGSGKKEFTLSASSPCLPGNHPQGATCGIIGSEGEGCAALAVETTTWGAIKNRYQK